MDELVERGEEPEEQPEEREVSPSEVWEQLSPELQARVTRLLARMAYKYALAQRRSSPEGDGGGGESKEDGSQNQS